jgi:hypothetical protein
MIPLLLVERQLDDVVGEDGLESISADLICVQRTVPSAATMRSRSSKKRSWINASSAGPVSR